MFSPFGLSPPHPTFFLFCCGFILPYCSCFNYTFIFPNIFFIFLILFCFLLFDIVQRLFFFLSFFYFYLFIFLPHHEACEMLVLRPEVGTKLLWWKLRVQTTGLTEKLRPRGIFIRVRSHRGPHLSTKTRIYLTACKLQCWMPQAK